MEGIVVIDPVYGNMSGCSLFRVLILFLHSDGSLLDCQYTSFFLRGKEGFLLYLYFLPTIFFFEKYHSFRAFLDIEHAINQYIHVRSNYVLHRPLSWQKNVMYCILPFGMNKYKKIIIDKQKKPP